MPGLRWVPVPLAVLLTALGWLVFGSVLGQHAFASAHAGLQAGGLGLTVDSMNWMDEMSNPAASGKSSSGSGGFAMPADMMPGLQTTGDQRLRVEVLITNITNKPQQYALTDFTLLGSGHHSWPLLQNSATRGQVLTAPLAPGFQATVDLYFDVPSGLAKHLSVQWSHGGETVTIPVHAGKQGSMPGM
jgi:hypothetical protein